MLEVAVAAAIGVGKDWLMLALEILVVPSVAIAVSDLTSPGGGVDSGNRAVGIVGADDEVGSLIVGSWLVNKLLVLPISFSNLTRDSTFSASFLSKVSMRMLP